MIKNLELTGTPFNYSADDQNFVDSLLDSDLEKNLQVSENEITQYNDNYHLDKTFEDED